MQLDAASGQVVMRSLLRTARRVAIAFTPFVLIGVIMPNRNVLAWTIGVCITASFALLPVYALARMRFGRLLRKYEPHLAEQFGMGSKFEQNGIRSLLSVEAVDAFLNAGKHRDFNNENLKRAATFFLWTVRIGIAFASAMLGSVLAAVAVAVILRQYAP
jgi:hypothetical protein